MNRPRRPAWSAVQGGADGLPRGGNEGFVIHDRGVQHVAVDRVGSMDVGLVNRLAVTTSSHPWGTVGRDAEQGHAGMEGFGQGGPMVQGCRARGANDRYRRPRG